LGSDIKNVKDFLTKTCIYILGKFIDSNKANSIKDLEGVSKTVWDFISSLYKAHWDSVVTQDP